MGIGTRRPPLPAPTESMDEHSGVETEVATNITARTDKTSYSIPEDGSPITISTQKLGDKDSGGRHRRQKSQTSLLIEYFEASKSGDKSKSKPSVRVRVSSGAAKKDRTNDGAIQITGIGQDSKPSYTRRISLNNSKSIEVGRAPAEGTELSNSSGSQPPVDIEVMKDGSDVSRPGLRYAPQESNVSSMPPDSLLEANTSPDQGRSRGVDVEDEYLTVADRDRDRSASRDRIAQKVMEKLGQTGASSKSHRERGLDSEGRRRRKSSKSRDEDTVSGAESSLRSSHISPSHRSYHSNSSQASKMTNNPKLLEMVEDTIKRMILPEISAIKKDQKSATRRGSLPRDGYEEEGLSRSLSKSSSTPNFASKPRVVLNREGDDPGVTLSRGDSEYRKVRRSSRDSDGHRTSSRKSSGTLSKQGDGYDGENSPRHRSSRSSRGLKEAAVGAVAGGALTAAALRHHNSHGEDRPRRKKHSKSRSSRSRSASITETQEAYTKKEGIPPMPLAGGHDDSDLTRESLMSSGRDATRQLDPSTPTRATFAPTLGMSHSNRSTDSPTSPHSTKVRAAALAAAAAGLTGAKTGRSRHVDADGYGDYQKSASPVQSVSSLKKQFEEDDQLIPSGLRPRSAASYSSAGREQARSARSSPGSAKLDRASPASPLQNIERSLKHQDTPGTPNGESVDEWYERQHQMNQKYRNSYGESNRDSYQTNPFAEDEKRFSSYTDTSLDRIEEVKPVGLQPAYIHDSFAAESNVASLMDPSMISDGTRSYQHSPSKPSASYADRMNEHLRDMGKGAPPVMYEGSTMSQTVPSRDRWAAIKGQAQTLSANNSRDSVDATREVKAKDGPRKTSLEPVMSASGVPVADDPLPEIGHFDDSKSDVTTNPSIIKGPLGGDATGNSTWPYTPEPQPDTRQAKETKGSPVSHTARNLGMAGVAVGGAAALMAARSGKKPTAEEERLTPDMRKRSNARETTPSSQGFRDEGYATDNRARSAGPITPGADHSFLKRDVNDFHRAMDAQDLGADDPFLGQKDEARKVSGNSHGVPSPIYDSATGKGVDRIQSKDIVALMDHLTVRDAQRNARDTEILVTLVRSAAEMRQSFDEMRKFIAEQDRLIMQNATRDAEQTVQKVLVGGPRPQPGANTRARPAAATSEEDVQTKRKNVLRRALKGLTGGKKADDLARVEDMLMQILGNVEELKQGGPPPSTTQPAAMSKDSITSYERLRSGAGSGYEPEGHAGTSSSASQSGLLNNSFRGEKQSFHSGYDGRRGSVNRVSTVAEGDEDDLEPHEDLVLRHQFENNERMLTPTQANVRARAFSPDDTPPHFPVPSFRSDQENLTPRMSTQHSRHKSNTSSGIGPPKISRWSKTTASTNAADAAAIESPRVVQPDNASSDGTRSRSQLDEYDDDDDRSITPDANRRGYSRSHSETETRSMRSQGSRLTRTPSPLIPSEASSQSLDYNDLREESPVQEDLTFDDPKYHAHRNSLQLQHPQPRQGSTSRHQNTLEVQAHDFDDPSTNSDVSQRSVSDFDPAMWGSSGTAALSRNRFSQAEPISPVSMSSPNMAYSKQDAVASKPATSSGRWEAEDDGSDDMDWEPEPQFSNSGFGKGGYYSSPYGSGHLLEPIQEVRYSLETDRTISPDPQATPTKKADMRSAGRKITGPRPMSGVRGGNSPNTRTADSSGGVETSISGTVRRKPLPGTRASIDSLDSETF